MKRFTYDLLKENGYIINMTESGIENYTEDDMLKLIHKMQSSKVMKLRRIFINLRRKLIWYINKLWF